MVEGIQSESLGLFCPELTIRSNGVRPRRLLCRFAKLFRIEEGGDVARGSHPGGWDRTARRCLPVVRSSERLAVGPRMSKFREPMVDTVLGARVVKGVGPKALTGRSSFRISPILQPPRGSVN